MPVQDAAKFTAQRDGLAEPLEATVLSIFDDSPPSLEGIECFEKLTSVVFSVEVSAPELRRLGQVASLRELRLSTLASFEPLTAIPQLTRLEVLTGSASDLGPLRELVNLRHLVLAGLRDLRSVQPLGSLTSLRSLSLFDIAVTSTSGEPPGLLDLSNLELEELELAFSPCVDLGSLATSRLQAVTLWGSSCPNLEQLGAPSDGSGTLQLIDIPAAETEDAVTQLCGQGWCVEASGSSLCPEACPNQPEP